MTVSFVSLSHVGKTYPSPRGDIVALADVNLEIAAGEFISILGTQWLRQKHSAQVHQRTEAATIGDIRIGGTPLAGPPHDLGMVFQSDVLLDWLTIVENIVLTAHFKRLDAVIIRKKALEFLALFGLDGFENRHPWELSGGMRQRAAICRALVDDPKLRS